MALNTAQTLEPRFSIAERDRRYAAVRERMKERRLDCLLFPHHTGEWDNYQAGTRYFPVSVAVALLRRLCSL